MEEKIGYPVVLLATAILMSRIRMKRQLRRFGKMEWIYKTKARFDNGLLSEIGSAITAFPYPPKEFWISKEGILIKGPLYLIPISFTHVQSVVHSKRRGSHGGSLNLSTSSQKPIRIQTTESRKSILITPENPDEFAFQCSEANPSASHLFSSTATAHG